jgi:hypothetical protein
VTNLYSQIGLARHQCVEGSLGIPMPKLPKLPE